MLYVPSAKLTALAALALLVAALCTVEAEGQPLGTEFTYQGQLKISGVPLHGTADFEIKLFDAPSGGVQHGGTNPINNVHVVDGLFTVPLNFGPGAFNGNQRWLEIAVRSPAGSGNFTTLSPRQPLTAAPYALYALTGPGSGGPWTVSGNNVFNTNTGNVGIGTATPNAPLHIASDLFPVIAIQDIGSDSTQAGYVGFWNGSSAETGWIGFGSPSNPHFSMSNARVNGDVAIYTGPGGNVRMSTSGAERMVVTAAGNVGIGTLSPAAKLEVRGDIRLGPSGQYRATSSEENLRIIRGEVGPAGEIRIGSGFTVSIIGTGQCDITFTTPFSGTPIVTATPHKGLGGSTAEMIVMIGFISSTKVSLFTRNAALSEWGNWYIDFIAIGPR